MILGVGPNLSPAIKKAIEMGYHVITVDCFQDNIGHKHSHQFVNFSTVDKEGVLKGARENSIDGIMTMGSDVAVPSVGYVYDMLGLPGVSEESAEKLSNKKNFREFQRKIGINQPEFVTGDNLEDIESKLSQLSPPFLFRPIDTSGSRGITTSSECEKAQYMEAFKNAKRFSRSGIVCIEEFLE